MRIYHVVGARPNFMKAAPVLKALERFGSVSQSLIHTGQHYDRAMSEVFFEELSMPQPDLNLGVGSGTHAWQTAMIMMRLEELLLGDRPDWVVVYGDVNSTAAAALVCAKLLIPVAHVEAGLRSFDRTMPEEVNRLVTDQIADALFTPSPDGDENLLREGIPSQRIHLVGNVMIDTLVELLGAAKGRPALQSLGLAKQGFGLVTLHRPSNVDDPEVFISLIKTLQQISRRIPLIFPIHPRTRKRLAEMGLHGSRNDLRLMEPLGYLDFLALQRQALFVITDSGGIQEETTYLGIPCLTFRENTERPVTLTIGSNLLMGQDCAKLKRAVEDILSGQGKRGEVPPFWDGKASHRIARILTGDSRVAAQRGAPARAP